MNTRIGIIDLGTNSVRFDVHQLDGKARISRLHREKLMIRLGQGVFLNGELDKNAIRRTLHAFLRFKRVATHLKAGKIIAFGTSALREAADRDKLVELIRKKARIEVRVISGEEEAALIARGVLANEAVGKGRFALVDIGGGSTEISICQGRRILHSCSLPMGTARLQQVFLKTVPPAPAHVDELRAYIRTTIQQRIDAENWPQIRRIVGSSGTIRALVRMLRKGGPAGTASGAISRRDLHALVSRMSGMTQEQLLGVPGMEERRVDMILSGAILLEEVMRTLGADKAVSTEFSLRDGVLEEERQLIEQHATSNLTIHLPDLVAVARRFGAHEAHLSSMVRLADALFERLRPLHGLSDDWRIYLAAATVLKNTGESITLVNYEQHSAYIVQHMDFPASQRWEQEFVALLCLHQKSPKVAKKSLPFRQDKRRLRAFMRLLGLLQIVDALDAGRQSQLTLQRSTISSGAVRLRYAGRRLTGLESLNVELRKTLFRKIYRRDISAEPV